MNIQKIIAFQLLCLTYKFSFAQEHEIYTSGRLILGTYEERSASVATGDIDGDGDKENIVANGRQWTGQNRSISKMGWEALNLEILLGLTMLLLEI
mgnify:CR=1 FL=1